ncbi:NAD(P)/FAD-dependent oxidoreductase [Kitasatospora sp. NPDC101183]|uniref:NAD(P)/FAD-dependent oxidoreductase n=1 Tax=Kitasatospora sp. NPDC101183 TaxID=3364100 RepID=UPI00380C5787
MPTAVIAGGSVAGLASALALAGAGYRVLVLERAPEPPRWPTTDAASPWKRPTVPQGLQSHTLTSLGVRVLRERAPKVLAAAEAAGAPVLDLTRAAPAGGAMQPGDGDLVALGCRRSTLEILLHRAVRELPQALLRHDTTVIGLELRPGDRRVEAVLTGTGERLPADVVVDATGRRALSRRWLHRAGVPVAADLTAPAGLVGHTRFYRLKGAGLPGPLDRGHGVGDVHGHYAGVLHPGDSGTFSVALGSLPGDEALRGLRTRPGFTAAARATPGLAAWLEPGVSSPVSPVRVIAAPPNTLRGAAGPEQVPVPGLFQVGDAACLTNPLFGRGISLALEHAFRLADLLAERPSIDAGQRLAAARMTYGLFLPWYEQAAASDRLRIARWRAAVDGAEATVPLPSSGLPSSEEIVRAARADGTVWRRFTRMLMTLTTPAELFADEEFLALVRQAPATPAAAPPPGRGELVRLVAAAEGGRA